MNSKPWQQARLKILGGCSLAIFLSLLVNLWTKPPGDRFLQKLAINNWEAINTDKINSHGKTFQGRRDRARIAGNDLTVEVYYVPNYYSDNKNLIQQYRQLETLPEIKVFENKNIGYYGLSTGDRRAYLNTCIHSQGKTAFSRKHHATLANNNIHSRWLPWFLGQTDLRDWDCLWVNMSVTLDNIGESEAYSLLERQLLDLVAKIY